MAIEDRRAALAAGTLQRAKFSGRKPFSFTLNAIEKWRSER
ncbi:hypothetical protein [Herbiconiux sp. VKM Ac-2851]